jgi:hypothetical protein
MLRRLIYGVVAYILVLVSDVVVVYDHVTLCQHGQIQASVTPVHGVRCCLQRNECLGASLRRRQRFFRHGPLTDTDNLLDLKAVSPV